MKTRETIKLDSRAQHRLLVLNHVLAGELTATEAAAYLNLALRSVRRLLARYRSAAGVAALVHGNTGRTPANRLTDVTHARLVELATSTYAGVNRAHLADLLAEREGLSCPSADFPDPVVVLVVLAILFLAITVGSLARRRC